MDLVVCCPRCGGEIRRPDVTRSEWTCPRCGPGPPLHIAQRVDREVLAAVIRAAAGSPSSAEYIGSTGSTGSMGSIGSAGSMGSTGSAGSMGSIGSGDVDLVPLWCPWPLMMGWMVTGVAWAGVEAGGARATAVALAGPSPLSDAAADAVFVAEQPGVGLGTGLVGTPGLDPGAALRDAVAHTAAQAKIKAGGRPTPLWAVASLGDRSAYAGEARGVWLYAIAWPAQAGYVLAEEIHLHDLIESVPSELLFGTPTGRLRPRAPRE